MYGEMESMKQNDRLSESESGWCSSKKLELDWGGGGAKADSL